MVEYFSVKTPKKKHDFFLGYQDRKSSIYNFVQNRYYDAELIKIIWNYYEPKSINFFEPVLAITSSEENLYIYTDFHLTRINLKTLAKKEVYGVNFSNIYWYEGILYCISSTGHKIWKFDKNMQIIGHLSIKNHEMLEDFDDYKIRTIQFFENKLYTEDDGGMIDEYDLTQEKSTSRFMGLGYMGLALLPEIRKIYTTLDQRLYHFDINKKKQIGGKKFPKNITQDDTRYKLIVYTLKSYKNDQLVLEMMKHGEFYVINPNTLKIAKIISIKVPPSKKKNWEARSPNCFNTNGSRIIIWAGHHKKFYIFEG